MADTGTFSGGAWGTQAGPNAEGYVTVSTLMANNESCRILLRAKDIGNSATVDGYMALFERFDAIGGFTLRYYRYTDGGVAQIGADVLDVGGALAPGVKFGFEIVSTTLTAYVNRAGTWNALANRTDATYGAAGYIGFYASDAAGRYDDFGGGTVVVAVDTTLAWIKA